MSVGGIIEQEIRDLSENNKKSGHLDRQTVGLNLTIP